MEILPFTKEYSDSCVEIFVSNLDKYFADHELDEFRSFLEHVAHCSTYFVLREKDQVIACGGYEKERDHVILTWGMVKREIHGQGYGKKLTLYRLNAIQSAFPDLPVKIDTSQFKKGFYEKQGFKTLAIEKDGYKPGLDKYIMILSW